MIRPQNSKHRVFEFIARYVASNREAPTIKEIGNHLNFSSPASVHRILVKLEAEGLIKRTPNISRGVEIVNATATPVTGWLDR